MQEQLQKKNELKIWEAAGASPLAAPGFDLPELAVQHIWFELTRAGLWHSLALVAADSDVSVVGLAQGLATMAALNPSDRVLLVNTTIDYLEARAGRYEVISADGGSQGDLLQGFVPELRAALEVGHPEHTTVIITADYPGDNPAAIPLVRAVDACLVCVELGKTRLGAARRTIRILGPERVFGSVVLRPSGT